MDDDPRFPIYALAFAGKWYLAQCVPVDRYGRLAETTTAKFVWSEYKTTALICEQGEEQLLIGLPTIPN